MNEEPQSFQVHTVREAAGIMKLSEKAVYRLVWDGELRAKRAGRKGGRILITASAIQEYLEGGDGTALAEGGVQGHHGGA